MTHKTKESAQKHLKKQIVALSRLYAEREFGEYAHEFSPGETYIPPSGKVIAGPEVGNAVETALDGWFTEGHWTDEFERAFAKALKVRKASLCNSGSSANLLAMSALTSERLGKDRLKREDEVIVAAAGFPTTLNPVIQNGLTPVFVDVNPETYVPDLDMVDEAITDRTRAIFLAHTMGNPNPILGRVKKYLDKGIFVIEDNCDALGSTYKGKRTGSFGIMATSSFYPAHHITAGEAGMVVTNKPKLYKIIESFRDWGRDCWCPPGDENTCGKRFEWDFPNLPEGYDHKYVYSHIGYNLKATDFQASIGLAQLDRLEEFTEARVKNFNEIFNALKPYEEFFILPKKTRFSEPSWFGFLITVKPHAPFKRHDFVRYLNKMRIGTRNLFGGNLLMQPAYQHIQDYRSMFEDSDLENSNRIAESTFWIGNYPGIDEPRMTYMKEAFEGFMKKW